MSDAAHLTTAYLGLGSNLGDRVAHLCGAAHALDAHSQIRVDFPTGVASLYETAPVGGPANQGLYLNSAIRIETALSPFDLLTVVLSIETDLGRVQRERWGPRVIDIDVLLYDEVIINDETLSLPHLRLHERCFVLEPLAEIAGDVVHPLLNATLTQLARQRRNLWRTVRERADKVVRIAGPLWYDASITPGKRFRKPITGRDCRTAR